MGRVGIVEHLGADSHVTCEIEADDGERTLVARTDGAGAPQPGERVQLGIEAETSALVLTGRWPAAA